MVSFLGVPIIRMITFWDLYWGTLILGKHYLGFRLTAPQKKARRAPTLGPKLPRVQRSGYTINGCGLKKFLRLRLQHMGLFLGLSV